MGFLYLYAVVIVVCFFCFLLYYIFILFCFYLEYHYLSIYSVCNFVYSYLALSSTIICQHIYIYKLSRLNFLFVSVVVFCSNQCSNIGTCISIYNLCVCACAHVF